MRESSKAALGGIVSALGIVIMLITYISPLLVYTAPPFAGLILIVMQYEIGGKWAFGAYAAISLLSVFMIADKEAAVFFVVFFGYYPILREYLNSKIKKKFIYLPLELVIFNISVSFGIFISSRFFAVDYSELTEGGKLFLAVFWFLLNIVFFAYDFLLEKMVLLYKHKIQKRIRKLFKN